MKYWTTNKMNKQTNKQKNSLWRIWSFLGFARLWIPATTKKKTKKIETLSKLKPTQKKIWRNQTTYGSVGRLNGTVSEVARKFVMEMGRWRVNFVPKREVRERVHDWLLLENEREKSVLVLVLGLRRRECEEKVGMEAIEERERGFGGCAFGWVWMNL
jgi:hypothetical protein